MGTCRRKASLWATTALSLAALAGPALADQADSKDQLPEVVVTAQKRSENLTKVPEAVSVVTADALKDAGVVNAEFLQELVPSLTFKKGTTNVNETLSIRGIGTQSYASGAEPSVSTVVDGVVMGRSGMAFTEFTDIAQIEVLQGPQGTLFGKNASAGAVNITTREPGKTFEGNAQASYFEDNEYRAAVNLSGPITDKVRASISTLLGSYDGNVQNLQESHAVNGYRRAGARGKVVADVTSDLTLHLTADYVHAHDDCCADIIGTVVPGNAAIDHLFVPLQGSATPSSHNMAVNQNLPPLTIDTNWGLALQADYALPEGYTVTSISAYRNWYNLQQRDGDFLPVAATYANSTVGQLHDVGALDFRQYSEELRLTSPVGHLIDFVVGGFFWYTHENDWFTRSDFNCTASTLPADATGFRPCAPGASTFVTTQGTANFATDFHNEAGFGQATANLTDSFRLIAGARYTHDSVDYTFARTISPVTGPGIAGPFKSAGVTSDNGWSAKGGAQYDLDKDTTTYVTYSRGYKGPAYNVFFNMGALNTNPIAPETSDAYEAGVKSTLFDRHLQVNAAAFYETFNNFQANSFVLVNGATTTSLTNAGEVRSKGFNADVTWHPFSDLSLVGGYSYDDAYIVSYKCAGQTGGALASCLAIHDGAPLPFAPKNKFTATGNWFLPLKDVPFETRLMLNYTYQTVTNFDIDQTPLARQPAYGLLNASVTFSTLDDRYSVSVIGKNLTNQFYTGFITPAGNGVSPGSYARLQILRDAERYFGVTLNANF